MERLGPCNNSIASLSNHGKAQRWTSHLQKTSLKLRGGMLELGTGKYFICTGPKGLPRGCVWMVGEALTPVLWFPPLMQPARQGLKYVIPSDPQTGSYS